jgi:chemotaxis protein histidine kinase CheA
VVKPLGRPLAGVPGIAAATVLGDGRVGLILDIPGLMSQVRQFETKRGETAARHEEKR